MTNLLLLLVVGLALILQLANVSAGTTTTSSTFYPTAANEQGELMFDYTGRWQFSSSSSSSPSLLKKKHHHEGIARADWPCSGVQFRIQTTTSTTTSSTTAIRTKSVNHQDNDNKSAVLTLRLGLNRVQVRVVITNDATGKVESSTILEGKSFWDSVKDYDVPLPLDRSSSSNDNDQSFTVSLTKLTQPSPYMMGVGHSLTSILHFHGVSVPSDAGVRLVPFQRQQSRRRRRVQVIGASDTAGYCVDGTPDTADAKVLPWKYDNCDATSHAVLGRRFAADMSIQAIPGIGLTQNAFADKPYLLGKPTMPDYYPRVLQTESTEWKFADEPSPDLVVVSLGGNDFNHQLQVPSSRDFESAYHALLHQIAEPYLNKNDEQLNVVPTIVSICGQGDPTEHARDPNNDRCRPCPAVQQAVESFATKSENSHIKVDYVFIPCDGTVVTGIDDIGCEGHKNRLGQLRVANYLEPRLRDIMKWHDDDENDSTAATNTVVATNSKNRDALFDFEGEIVVTPASLPRSRRSKILWGLSLLTIVALVGRRLTHCCRSSCCCCRGGATTTGPQYRRSSSTSTSGSAMRKRYYYNRQRCSTASLSLSLEDDDNDFDDDIEDDDIDKFGKELRQQQACFDRSEEYYSTASSSDSESDNEDNQPQQRIVV